VDPHPPTEPLARRGAAALGDDIAIGRTTAREVVEAALERIEAIERAGSPQALSSVIALAPDAVAAATARDRELAVGRRRGPLHGVPVLVKDNVEATGLPGSAGSLALAGRPVLRDAPLVARLRDAGAVVLGATNLSEWANIRSPRSASGWSAVGGLTRNPWALDRSAGGSSSGSGAAVAAGLAPLAIGTETDGSITCPASLTGCVGLKPTVGLVPTRGVVPISASQDAPGPLARSVLDAAHLFDAVGGVRTASACGALAPADLQLRVADGWRTGDPLADAAFDAALDLLRSAGARLTEADLAPAPHDVHEAELVVLLTELREGLDAYLPTRDGDGPCSLTELVDFNRANADRELVHFGQEHFEAALELPGSSSETYRAARARCLAWALDECLTPALTGSGSPHALLAPAYGRAWTSDLTRGDGTIAGGRASTAPSIAGWPVLCVPMSVVAGLPVGLALIGRPHEEATLVAVGHAVEAVLGVEIAPTWSPSVD
jgi:amidase